MSPRNQTAHEYDCYAKQRRQSKLGFVGKNAQITLYQRSGGGEGRGSEHFKGQIGHVIQVPRQRVSNRELRNIWGFSKVLKIYAPWAFSHSISPFDEICEVLIKLINFKLCPRHVNFFMN